ncbi:hypothetical protein RRG08_008397 [Elysia crispata]|uniref:Uncharacterized protein n=1 Tax=Elysia crispata TaxID=231223 RepID=A0AAE1BBE4_9GAST|nr:hypothetical protein RRG08_008397 [Elysia crispata]
MGFMNQNPWRMIQLFPAVKQSRNNLPRPVTSCYFRITYFLADISQDRHRRWQILRIFLFNETTCVLDLDLYLLEVK